MASTHWGFTPLGRRNNNPGGGRENVEKKYEKWTLSLILYLKTVRFHFKL